MSLEGEKKLLLEGLLPTDIWNALIVLLILFGVFIAVFKGVTMIRDEIQKSMDKKALKGDDITDRIANKVIEQLTPKLDEKFAEIDRKLAADKEAIDLQMSQLNAQKDRVDRLDNDNRALLHGMSALLGHIATGNSIDRVKKTNATMNNYLIDRKYHEEDWT